MAHDVFVSHSSKDKPAADAVCAVLESQGIRCWIAPRDIIPGKHFGASIVEAIKRAKVMVLLFSADANASPHVLREVERAVNHGTAIIPVRMADIVPTESLEFFLSSPHWLDAFPSPLDHHFQRLTQVVRQIISQPLAVGLPSPPAPPSEVTVKTAMSAFPQAGQRRTNSLGQIFVPVPGTFVLFCIWDTRVRDYREYAHANRGVDGSWKDPVYKGQKVTPTEDCPVVNVSWDDAKAFCEWLTGNERQQGKISENQSYRLPADWEWSVAVGLHEAREGTPKDKLGQTPGVYPWGTNWPPRGRVGNYADATAKRSFSDWPVIEGYDDGYATTSPVGSYEANRFGLFDMGGNVLQWCEDWYDDDQKCRVLRGASWTHSNPGCLLSADRYNYTPDSRRGNFGFRVVLVSASAR